MDIVDLIFNSRRNTLALDSSILCSQSRREMLKHCKKCVIDVDTTESENELDQSEVGVTSKGVCKANQSESIITENIKNMILSNK